MRSIAGSPSAVYEYGTSRRDEAGRRAPTYEPLGADGIAASTAPEPWSDSDREGWLAAALADSRRDHGGGW